MGENRNQTDFLGCGWKFPPEVNSVTGRVEASSREDDIAEAIRLILFTGKGERVMRPDFGCGVRKYVFSDMSLMDIHSMEEEIQEALIRWEPRIVEPEVKASTERIMEGMLEIQVSYKVRSTNNPYNLVFPYYINEGAGYQ